jgi:hypothetical protein
MSLLVKFAHWKTYARNDVGKDSLIDVIGNGILFLKAVFNFLILIVNLVSKKLK